MFIACDVTEPSFNSSEIKLDNFLLSSQLSSKHFLTTGIAGLADIVERSTGGPPTSTVSTSMNFSAIGIIDYEKYIPFDP